MFYFVLDMLCNANCVRATKDTHTKSLSQFDTDLFFYELLLLMSLFSKRMKLDKYIAYEKILCSSYIFYVLFVGLW